MLTIIQYGIKHQHVNFLSLKKLVKIKGGGGDKILFQRVKNGGSNPFPKHDPIQTQYSSVLLTTMNNVAANCRINIFCCVTFPTRV